MSGATLPDEAVLNDEFRSIYVVSGQAWKIAGAGIALVLGLVVTLARWLELPPVADMGIIGALATAILVLGSLAFAARTVRCPTCDARWVWIAVSERDHREWLSWALGLEFCPRCGYGSRPYTPQSTIGSDASGVASASRHGGTVE
jgi:hypothetical protein